MKTIGADSQLQREELNFRISYNLCNEGGERMEKLTIVIGLMMLVSTICMFVFINTYFVELLLLTLGLGVLFTISSQFVKEFP